MMMQMLEAAGFEIATDGRRVADQDNPKGYYEYEAVKDLDKGGDKGWVEGARGKVVKVVSPLLQYLPDSCYYKVVFMERNLAEVLSSQSKMLERREEASGESTDEEMAGDYVDHLRRVKYLLGTRPNFEAVTVRYRQAVEGPGETAARVAKFLGGGLDRKKMTAVADRNLYRNRS